VLNGAQLLTAPAVAIWARVLTGRVGFVGSAALMAVGQIGILLTPGAGVIVWAFVIGFAAALSFIVTLSFPPRVAAPGDVHRMSAAIFTIQYGCAFVLPLVAGALWDATGTAALAFVPGATAAAFMAWLAWPLRMPSSPAQ
jgi:MFS transporter, CP family, cyanate transporter